MFNKRFPKLPLPESLGTPDHLSVTPDAAEIAPSDAAVDDQANNEVAADGPLSDRDLSLEGLEKKAKLGAWFIAFGIMALTLAALGLALAF